MKKAGGGQGVKCGMIWDGETESGVRMGLAVSACAREANSGNFCTTLQGVQCLCCSQDIFSHLAGGRFASMGSESWAWTTRSM